MGSLSFLRIPPFPGSKAGPLSRYGATPPTALETPDALAEQLATARVGGAFWAAQPPIPQGRDLLLAPSTRKQAQAMLDEVVRRGTAGRALLLGPWPSRHGIPALPQPCDPWYLVDQVATIHAGADNELALVAALAGKPCHVLGQGRFTGLDCAGDVQAGLRACLEREVPGDFAFLDPFFGNTLSAAQAIVLLSDWRKLIDANRKATAIYGIAHWKRVTVNALLWDGGRAPRYAKSKSPVTKSLKPGDTVLAWKTRTPADLLQNLTARGIAVGEIEDGMIRSVGLGANCVPPLSILVDYRGAHFDPAQPSQLEWILQNEAMPDSLLARAAALREWLVTAGVSKYGLGSGEIVRPDQGRRRVLVTGQVEDDRSVLCGGAGLTNAKILRQARLQEPDAWIIYKPHPDVEAGHRKGFVPDAEILRHADAIERNAPILPLIDSVDAVHVITSLAGFEALMRGKNVTVHGVPFYAGWGLTTDLGPVPARRTRKRTLDELVAATLILYPRYLDPVTRLPCPVEILIDRLTSGKADINSPLVSLREAQGRLNLFFRRIMKLY